MSKEREYLHAIGVPVGEDWTVTGLSVERNIVEVQSEPDVYGNTFACVQVRGTQVTVKLYRTEN